MLNPSRSLHDAMPYALYTPPLSLASPLHSLLDVQQLPQVLVLLSHAIAVLLGRQALHEWRGRQQGGQERVEMTSRTSHVEASPLSGGTATNIPSRLTPSQGTLLRAPYLLSASSNDYHSCTPNHPGLIAATLCRCNQRTCFSAASAIFSPCSSVPVRNLTFLPSSLCQMGPGHARVVRLKKARLHSSRGKGVAGHAVPLLLVHLRWKLQMSS